MIKKLARSIREFKRDTILTPIFMMLEVVMEVIIPLLTASLIDYGIEKGDINHVLKIGIALVGCALVSMFFGICGGQKAAMASSGFARNLRHDLYHKFQSFSFGNIDKFSNASLITRMTTDVNNVQMAFQMLIRMAIRSPITLIFSCIMAFSINSTVSLIFLGCAPVLALGLYLIMTHAHPLFKKVFRTYDKLNRIVQENLRGVRVVKSFVRKDHEINKFNDVSDEIYTTFTRAEKLIAFNGPLMQLCLNTCLLLIAWIGAHLIVASGNDPAVGMTTGQLMSLITYAMQILMSLMMLSMVFVMLTISRTSAERIVEVLDEESSILSPADPVTCVKDGSVEFDGVSFSYSGDIEKLCLKNVNISIESGQTIGIVGGTGSSKSTLVQLIPRLYDVTCGTLRVGGVDVRDYDLTLLRDSVAMVLQKNTLFSGTIKENLRWGNEAATDEQLVEACRLACADGFITQFPDGYDTYIEQGGTNVSGGQRQRLCIARALLKNPKIIILDDSTSAVDTATDSSIRAAFKDYIPHVTKFIIAQRIASVKDADRIIVMENGEVNDFGTHEELLGRNAVYREIYDSQNKGGIGQ